MNAALALLPSILLALLFWYVAWAGSRDRLPRNAIVGIRLPATTRSDGAWFAAHRAAASSNIGAGIWFLLSGLAAATLATSDDGRATILFSGWVIALVWVALGAVRAVRAANAVTDTEPNDPGDQPGRAGT
ncbi:MAG: SdpI family protein [Actinomycetota bacterium]